MQYREKYKEATNLSNEDKNKISKSDKKDEEEQRIKDEENIIEEQKMKDEERIKEKEKEKEKDKEIEVDSPLTKLIYILLIYIFYIFGGLFNEKLTKNEYEYLDSDNNLKIFKFKDPLIILCTLSSFSLLVSLYMSNKLKLKFLQNPKLSPLSFQDQSILGILHTISTFTSQLSLLYIDFIVKTIGKSCKSASIIFLYFLNSIVVFLISL